MAALLTGSKNDNATTTTLRMLRKTASAIKSKQYQVSILSNFFPSLLMTRPKKLECFYLAITFQSSLTFAGRTRSLPMKDASGRCSNGVGSGLALKF